MLARILIATSWVSRSPGSVEIPITAGSSCHGAAQCFSNQVRSLEKLSTLRASRPLHWRQVRLLHSTKLVLIV